MAKKDFKKASGAREEIRKILGAPPPPPSSPEEDKRLTEALKRWAEHKKKNPNWMEDSIKRVVEAEAALNPKDDPREGKIVKTSAKKIQPSKKK